tara:strand:+ start:640 stop:1209 length:570 start_codon:yes stop_codon:yes gene_type:complete
MNLLREYIGRLLDKQQVNILIPPQPSDEKRVKELSTIQSQMRNPYNSLEVQDDLDKNMTKLFNNIIKMSGNPGQKSLIKKLKNEIKPNIIFHKDFFNAERPQELASRLGISFAADDLDSAKSPSYPSGHTTQAFYLALVLSRLYPNLKNQFFILANMIAKSRIDRGVHFPSDLEAGKILALTLYRRKFQ